MTLSEAIIARRTIRKYDQREIEYATLEKLIKYASLAPSGSNLQPLKYKIVTKADAPRLFPLLKWAGYIAPEGDPKPGEEPTAYIVILGDTNIRKNGWEHDSGAAAQNIMLGAQDEGIATCWLGSVNRAKLVAEFEIPENLVVDTVIALGYPAEKSVAETAVDSIKYYKDENGTYHVPKRPLDEIII